MFRHGVAEQRHRSGVSRSEPQQHPDQRRLSGTVGTEIAECAATRNEQLYSVDRQVAPEPFSQTASLYRPCLISHSHRLAPVEGGHIRESPGADPEPVRTVARFPEDQFGRCADAARRLTREKGRVGGPNLLEPWSTEATRRANRGQNGQPRVRKRRGPPENVHLADREFCSGG